MCSLICLVDRFIPGNFFLHFRTCVSSALPAVPMAKLYGRLKALTTKDTKEHKDAMRSLICLVDRFIPGNSFLHFRTCVSIALPGSPHDKNCTEHLFLFSWCSFVSFVVKGFVRLTA